MHSSIRKLFVGPTGVRSGWRVLLFYALVAALVFAVLLVIRAIRAWLGLGPWPSGVLNPGRAFLGEANILSAVLIAGALFSRFEGRSLADYGLRTQGAYRARFLEGLLWGIVMLSGVLLVLRATVNFHFGPITDTPEQMVVYAVVWAVIFIMLGVAESFAFSGYPLFALTRGLGFWPAAAVLAVLFGTAHFVGNAGENWLGSASLVIVGLMLAFTIRRTGSLWFAIGIHSAWDWGQSFLYGVPDSGNNVAGHLFNPSFQGSHWMTGGTAGPEASVVTLIGYVFAFALINFRFPATHDPARAAAN
jgi:CAAX protease family protein